MGFLRLYSRKLKDLSWPITTCCSTPLSPVSCPAPRTGAVLVDPTPLHYAAQAAAAAAFATELDAQIALDATISAVGGAALPPTTAAIQEAQTAKTALLEGLCDAVWTGRYSTDPTPTDSALLCIAVAASYSQAIQAFVS